MWLFDIFSSKRDVESAQAICSKLMTSYPAKVESKLQYIGGKKRLGGVLEIVLADVDQYQQDSKMGWFRKARFANAFKWRLREAGYSEAFTDAITEGVVTRLMSKSE